MVLQPCPMCSILVERDRLIRHFLTHKNEPNFRVYCLFCGVSYTKWTSFRTHIYRKHRDEEGNFGLEDHPEGPEGGDEIQEEPMEIENENGGNLAQNEQELPNIQEWQAASFYSKLQEERMLPKSTAQDIMDDVGYEINHQIRILQDAIKSGLQEGAESISVEHIDKVFREALQSNAFQAVHSTYLHEIFLKKYCNLVLPERITVGVIRSWSPEGRIVESDAVAYVVPFLKDLEALLNNRDILHCVDNPRGHSPGIYRTLLDGSSYRSHPVFLRDQKALGIFLYSDAVEFCDALGSKKRKLTMFYYSLANIYPELRSSDRVVNLLAIVNSAYVKRFGPASVLEGFITDVNKLSEGVSLNINGGPRKFSGFLLGIAGDTPASNELAGMKEGVGAARCPCRTCLVEKPDLATVRSESQVVLRDKETHARHVQRVTDPLLQRGDADYWSTFLGVNSKCCFVDMEGFDVTTAFPHDFMHICLEGTLEEQCRLFIGHCVEEGLFQLNELNSAIKNFQYGHLVKDKPSIIDRRHLQTGLKQSAAQMLALGFVLPFVVYQWVKDSVQVLDHLQNLIVLLQIVNLSLSFEITSEEVKLLKKMIEIYIVSFLNLYPAVTAKPKLHYMIHLPRQIEQFGPLRQQWCFRYEAAHQWFKRLTRKVRNFVNLPKTLAERRQKLRCVQLASHGNTGTKKFLYLGDVVRRGKVVSVENHAHSDLLVNHGLVETNNVMSSPAVTVHGTTYRKNTVLLLSDSEDALPSFGLVDEVLVYEQTRILLLYAKLITKSFNDKLNAYQIVNQTPPVHVHEMISVCDLLHPHPLSAFKCCGKSFIILMFHRRSEFTG